MSLNAMIAILLIAGFAAALAARAWCNTNRILAERKAAERQALLRSAPAESTFLDPHRDPGPVLVAPDEGDWRLGWGGEDRG